VPITSLRGYKRALKKHSKRNIEQLVASIQTFGFVQPIVVDAGGEIIAGHGLLAAAKQAGFREVPVIRLEHLDEAAVRALRIAL
jgi:ParB-like chromosome segregation protein Spo0J